MRKQKRIKYAMMETSGRVVFWEHMSKRHQMYWLNKWKQENESSN